MDGQIRGMMKSTRQGQKRIGNTGRENQLENKK